jgi:polar amino acid transport system substrate-binding protein
MNNSVDIVARNMTINCDRWSQIAFSAEYYRSGQKSLVPRTSEVKSLGDLPKGTTICTPTGSTSYANLRARFPDLTAITADTDGGCLALFQSGKAFGISGDDTVLAGDAAQDPYARVIPGEQFSQEPYGLGIAKTHPEFVRFVNGVLEQIKADGRWKKSYNKWFAAALGPAPVPPKPVYGRPGG